MDTADFFLVGWTGERNTSADRAAQIAEAKERRGEAEAAKLRTSKPSPDPAPAPASPDPTPAPASPAYAAAAPAPSPPSAYTDPAYADAGTSSFMRTLLRDTLLVTLAAGGIYLLWEATS